MGKDLFFTLFLDHWYSSVVGLHCKWYIMYVIQYVTGFRTSGVTIGDSRCGVSCGRAVRTATARNSAS